MRFLNQKLGKRTTRKLDLLKSELRARRAGASLPSTLRLPKIGASRERKKRA